MVLDLENKNDEMDFEAMQNKYYDHAIKGKDEKEILGNPSNAKRKSIIG